MNEDVNKVFQDTATSIKNKLNDDTKIKPVDFAKKIDSIVGSSSMFEYGNHIKYGEAIPDKSECKYWINVPTTPEENPLQYIDKFISKNVINKDSDFIKTKSIDYKKIKRALQQLPYDQYRNMNSINLDDEYVFVFLRNYSPTSTSVNRNLDKGTVIFKGHKVYKDCFNVYDSVEEFVDTGFIIADCYLDQDKKYLYVFESADSYNESVTTTRFRKYDVNTKEMIFENVLDFSKLSEVMPHKNRMFFGGLVRQEGVGANSKFAIYVDCGNSTNPYKSAMVKFSEDCSEVEVVGLSEKTYTDLDSFSGTGGRIVHKINENNIQIEVTYRSITIINKYDLTVRHIQPSGISGMGYWDGKVLFINNGNYLQRYSYNENQMISYNSQYWLTQSTEYLCKMLKNIDSYGITFSIRDGAVDFWFPMTKYYSVYECNDEYNPYLHMSASEENQGNFVSVYHSFNECTNHDVLTTNATNILRLYSQYHKETSTDGRKGVFLISQAMGYEDCRIQPKSTDSFTLIHSGEVVYNNKMGYEVKEFNEETQSWEVMRYRVDNS